MLSREIKSDHSDFLSIFDDKHGCILGRKVQSLLSDDTLQRDIGAICTRILDVHEHEVLLSIPDLNSSISLHPECVCMQADSLYHSDRLIKEGPLREADLECLLINI